MLWALDESARQALFLILSGAAFLIAGCYFGFVQKRVGLSSFMPITGDLARIWGGIMCALGAMLCFLALT